MRLEHAWKVLRRGRETKIDLGGVDFFDEGVPTKRYFMQLAGAGLDARAVELVSWKLKKNAGPLAYVVAGLQALVEKQSQITVTANGQKLAGELALFGNGKLYGGPFQIFPEAEISDGLLDACVFSGVDFTSLLRLVPNIVLRQRLAEKLVRRLRAEKFELIGADKRAREQERQSKATQEQTKTAAEQTLADLDAFPTQEMQLKFVKTDQSTPDELKQLAEAKVYDADRLKSETASALKFKDSEDYMKRHPDPVLSKELKASLTADQQAQKVKELTEAIRTKRKLFWQYAHDQRTLQEKEAAPVKPPPTAPHAPPDLSRDLINDYKKAGAKVLGEER